MKTETVAARGSGAVRRVLEAELKAARARGVEHPRVVDVGGGSGGWAVPFAAAGCRVTVVEPSPNALATLQRRAEEEGVADRITVIADDSDALGRHVEAGSADLVLAHGLLEIVDDPAAVLTALATAVAPGGAVSVLVANRHASVLYRALSGRVAEARQLLESADGVVAGDTVLRRFDADGLRAQLVTAGLDVTLLQGDRVISDLVGGDVREDELADFERVAAATPALREIASRLHAVARPPA
ncbi:MULTISPECIES: methyltransferase domain-containing protein [unclassified Amycolatopsis]|uniref:methyltransferase domain-containing protein n=1 Tax=unclassified Amycolatopsis TaxID=2618356 RepID=UPI001FF45415|nr:methyltransferase domain-containing protein [Amycolatopsis sp. FBCC-B4732]UOX89955.1 methyltransferase domain-containing protein [Amycolatopsis sp. FBCC-B4732]